MRTRDLTEHIEDGRAKLYLIWRVLSVRRRLPRLFQEGDYLPLRVEGSKAEHVLAFARHLEGAVVVCVAPRWFARLTDGTHDLPLGRNIWGDTCVEVPLVASDVAYKNVLTDQQVTLTHIDDKSFFEVATLLDSFPVALLALEGIDRLDAAGDAS